MLRSIWYKFAHICTVAQSIAQLCSCSAADRRLYLLLLHKCSLEHLHSCSLAQTIAQLWSCSTAQTIAQLCSCSGADRRLYLLLLHRSISISEQAGAPHWPTPTPNTLLLHVYNTLLCPTLGGPRGDLNTEELLTCTKAMP